MQFEYDPERLINEVKKRPGIWDHDHVDYKLRQQRHLLWQEIVNEMVKDGNVNFSKCEKRELELQLQKKWKSIRDCFQKYVANPSRTKRPYIYSKILRFLLHDPESSQLGTSAAPAYCDEPEEKTSSFPVWKSKKKVKVSKKRSRESSTEEEIAIHNDDFEDQNLNDTHTDLELDGSTKLSKNNKSYNSEFAFANVDAHSHLDNEDPDKLFLLSLLPHLKAIPEENRLNVKMEMMQVLQNACYSRNNKHNSY